MRGVVLAADDRAQPDGPAADLALFDVGAARLHLFRRDERRGGQAVGLQKCGHGLFIGEQLGRLPQRRGGAHTQCGQLRRIRRPGEQILVDERHNDVDVVFFQQSEDLLLAHLLSPE